MNWQIGDRAILVNCRLIENEGDECRIIGPMREAYGTLKGRFVGWPIECHSGKYVAEERQLKPIPDEYDGKQVSTWDEMNDKDYIWQPERVTVTI